MLAVVAEVVIQLPLEVLVVLVAVVLVAKTTNSPQ
tara:strand:- start:78 stop:182 length:105 start_codon:yes stop_codon:yes gene_type:complete